MGVEKMFEDPRQQALLGLSTGLLQAAGPSARPVSLGQALGGGMQNAMQMYQAAKQAKEVEDYKNQQIALMKLKEMRDQAEFDNRNKWINALTGNNTAPSAAKPAYQFDQYQTGEDSQETMRAKGDALVSSAQNQTPRQLGVGGLNLNTILSGAAMNMPGVKEALDIYKYQNEPQKLEAGSTYRDRITGQERYMPKLDTGAAIDAQGNYINMPGYVNSVSQLEGAKAGAIESAKARNNLVTITPRGENPTMLTQAQLLDMVGGGQPQQPAPAMPRQNAATPQNWKGINNQYATGAGDRQSEQLRILQDELRTETNPENRAALNREIMRVSGQQPAQQVPQAPMRQPMPQQAARAPGIQLQSKEEEARNIAAINSQFKTGDKLNDNWIDKTLNPVTEAGAAAKESKANITALRNIDFKTGWGTEAKAKAASVLTGLGIAPKNAEMFAANAEQFRSVAKKNLLTMLREQTGPQTDKDANNAEATYVSLGNTPQANQFILDFAEAMSNMKERKAQYYQEALPYARQGNDLTQIDRRWAKISGSIWSDPIMQKWIKK